MVWKNLCYSYLLPWSPLGHVSLSDALILIYYFELELPREIRAVLLAMAISWELWGAGFRGGPYFTKWAYSGEIVVLWWNYWESQNCRLYYVFVENKSLFNIFSTCKLTARDFMRVPLLNADYSKVLKNVHIYQRQIPVYVFIIFAVSKKENIF